MRWKIETSRARASLHDRSTASWLKKYGRYNSSMEGHNSSRSGRVGGTNSIHEGGTSLTTDKAILSSSTVLVLTMVEAVTSAGNLRVA